MCFKANGNGDLTSIVTNFPVLIKMLHHHQCTDLPIKAKLKIIDISYEKGIKKAIIE